ncbi:MAG: hypothetical protein IIZ78_18210 [Clostridiales bacterium]|nr:hypothetical protein [Clostridiales bacterium]
MATELGKAYVQIIPSAKGIGGSISSAIKGEATSAGQSAGLNIAGAIKGAIAAAGIGTAIKSALEAGGNLQQSFGGLETLYGDAAEGAKKYAAEAAKAGISANSYAEQAVSFGASLKQAFAGDAQSAMEAANTAIIDMADNAAKMGTPIESIQNAYQGFAKQNYTMLDNLKLGYGGTKSEMERLLSDAQKLTGVKYDLNNLGDVYSAIHVIQEDLGLTGVAASEASETFTGSLGAMKAAGENLLANLALGEDIGPALDSLGVTVNNFLFQNLLPMVANMLEAVPELISGLSGMLIQALNIVSTNSEEIVAQGLAIVTALAQAIVEALPYIVEAAINLAIALGEALLNTDWIQVGTDLITSLRDSIDLAAGEILGVDGSTLESFIDGIMQKIPDLITTAGELMITFADTLYKNLPTIMEKGLELAKTISEGIIKNLPEIAKAALEVIVKLIATIASNLPQILETGITIILNLVTGLLKAIPKIIAAIPQIISSIKETFGRYNWSQIGNDILAGIKNGILGAIGDVVNAAVEAGRSIYNAVTGFFDINSPSKKMEWIGKMDMLGLAKGVEDNARLVDDAMNDVATGLSSQLQVSADFAQTESVATQSPMVINMTINGAEGQDINELAELIQEKLASAVERRKLVYA